MSSELPLVNYHIPTGTKNPYLWAARRLHDEMYPAFSTGFSERVAGLVGLLCFVIVVAISYVWIQYRDSRQMGLKERVWIARVVRRSEGPYFVVNQHVLYPICSIFMAIVWIAYCMNVYQMFGKHGAPENLYFWIGTAWIPFYIHVATTTFAVISGANLASKTVSGSSHWSGPWIHNGLYVLMLPIVVAGMLAVGIWTAYGWHTFGESWNAAHDALLAAAATYNGTRDPTLDAHLLVLANARYTAFFAFYSRQHICTIIYTLSAALVIVVNLIGGITLLSKLRTVGTHRLALRDEPLVVPPHYSSTSLDAPQRISLSGSIPVSGNSAVLSNNMQIASGTQRLRRLEWDITLFFFAVIPACLAFIGFSIWTSLRYPSILVHNNLLELTVLGMIWIYSGLAAFSMSAIAIKKLLTKPELPTSAEGYESSLVRENKRRMYQRPIEGDEWV